MYYGLVLDLVNKISKTTVHAMLEPLNSTDYDVNENLRKTFYLKETITSSKDQTKEPRIFYTNEICWKK